MSKYCLINDARDILDEMLRLLDTKHIDENADRLHEKIHELQDLVARGEEEFRDSEGRADAACDERDVLQSEVDGLEDKITDLEEKLKEHKPNENSWRKDPDPYGLHGLTGKTTEEYFCGDPEEE